ncbi:alpha/beta hydrolase [Cellulosimicrobium sp. Marseille-Q4280]|uniref:alpha/beta hydrolase n=1 Tax=Cellulosimicrobium sp. Marseille-Q4280 TaxID=2937992 RepID=UPI00203A8ADB|nr:alpha/beta hydrolase [Cellulosimicrobium sp. Marseille-Q4280]
MHATVAEIRVPEPVDEAPRRRGAWGRWLRRFSATGLVLALVWFCVSFTPSLIPRAWYYQAVISGVSAIGGYGLGALVEWFAVKVGLRIRWSARASRVAWWVLAGAAAVLVPLSLVLGARRQIELRHLFGMSEDVPGREVVTLLLALLVALLVLQTARGLRRLAHWLSLLVDNVVPVPVARFASGVIVAVVVVLVVNGVIWSGVLSALNGIFATANDEISPRLTPPARPERSGSEASPETWESLGAEGRKFVVSGPTLDELRAFAQAGDVVDPADVLEPIHAYAGLDADGDLDATAARVVDELDRTDAWDRSVLVVVTTTGTGWVDPAMTEALELMHGGDTAIASMQYSYLPSWISFVGDRSTPPAAGKALFEAVYDRWSELPEDDRPRLLASGISLGSFGMQGAFSGVQDLEARTDGAMFTGTPGFTPLWRELTDARDPGSLEYAPMLDGGRQVRWGDPVRTGVADVWGPGPRWEDPRVVYLQHASDGVTWWSPETLWSEPDWLREPRGPDVLGDVRWYPFVTFWQLTGDLFVAAASDIPSGHGHVYELEYADGFAVLHAPDGWTEADTTRLKAAMDAPVQGGSIG